MPRPVTPVQRVMGRLRIGKAVSGKGADRASHSRRGDAKQVVGIRLPAKAGRDSGSRMDEQDRPFGDEIADGRIAAEDYCGKAYPIALSISSVR